MMIARTKRNLAIPAAAPEIPPKPRSPATIAMIAKINAHLSMIDSFHWRNTIADKGFRSLFGLCPAIASVTKFGGLSRARRSEEHTSELQSLMRISYAVFCLKKKKYYTTQISRNHHQDNEIKKLK